jgi:DNA (cytosine-5)-methyltransferase 1
MEFTFGSLFSGIGGFDRGLEKAGWKCRWQVEIDPWRRKILERHWPDVPRWEDIRKFLRDGSGLVEGRAAGSIPISTGLEEWAHVDLLCGGFPCQDLSFAGRRIGLKGERSGLFFEFARVARLLQSQWLLIENVPGLLSSNKGEDFAIVLETLSQCGYGLAWRVLDSQYFGVPQRRKRVYIVGYLNSQCPPEVLFESESSSGNSQKGQKTGESIAHALRASLRGIDEHTGTTYVSAPLGAHPQGYRQDLDHETYAVCTPTDSNRMRETPELPRWMDACPRCPDNRRYAALGDAVTVNVIEWVGRRIINSIINAKNKEV